MHLPTFTNICLLSCLLIGTPAYGDHQENSVCRELVHLLINFNGRAKPTERNTLANIIISVRASETEKDIARIMLNTQQAPDSHAQKILHTISRDKKEDTLLREVARILSTLKHHANEADRRYLKSLLRRQSNHSREHIREQLISASHGNR